MGKQGESGTNIEVDEVGCVYKNKILQPGRCSVADSLYYYFSINF